MDVCPKCHNQIVYGMNCCTGQRTLNDIRETERGFSIVMSCTSCGASGDQPHDPWRHQISERLLALENEVSDQKRFLKEAKRS